MDGRIDRRTAASGADLEDVNVKTHLHKYLLYLRLFLSGIGHEASGICVLKATVRTRRYIKAEKPVDCHLIRTVM